MGGRDITPVPVCVSVCLCVVGGGGLSSLGFSKRKAPLSPCSAPGSGHRVPAEVQAWLEGSVWAGSSTAQSLRVAGSLSWEGWPWGLLPQSLCASSHVSAPLFPSFPCHHCATSWTPEPPQARPCHRDGSLCRVGVQWLERVLGEQAVCACLACHCVLGT